jgi:hypothetical protein
LGVTIDFFAARGHMPPSISQENTEARPWCSFREHGIICATRRKAMLATMSAFIDGYKYG